MEQSSKREAASDIAAFMANFDRELTRSMALRQTVAVSRLHPDIARWLAAPGRDRAHDQVVRQWREHPAVSDALGALNPHKRDHEAGKLLSAARRFLEMEDEALAARWAQVRSSAAWSELPRSARDLYRALHAIAADPKELGGQRVLLAHRQAMDLIEAITGRRYKTLKTITNAWHALSDAGIAKIKPGKRGVRGRATTYELLPPETTQALGEGTPPTPITQALVPHRGLVYSGGDVGEQRDAGRDEVEFRPVLTDRQRQILLASFTSPEAARDMLDAYANYDAMFEVPREMTSKMAKRATLCGLCGIAPARRTRAWHLDGSTFHGPLCGLCANGWEGEGWTVRATGSPVIWRWEGGGWTVRASRAIATAEPVTKRDWAEVNGNDRDGGAGGGQAAAAEKSG